MEAKVKRRFIDRVTRKPCAVGEIIERDKKRIEELIQGGFVDPVASSEFEPTEPAQVNEAEKKQAEEKSAPKKAGKKRLNSENQ
ncbi:hypothetical protein [Mechercharimyces sp. CAU 1602]|uniref:hypothetical protein n=1 Tax=Mechercharimyces sp. CAU 1602 TaxID=2973933 RepID=UPI0021616BC8|nr:hypothetical protein [Mechercharimyces sp. CAU 1602]MCS1351151.1 hypothetical protein [Mechercharimyces sp. CAU 1602]